MFSAPVTGYGQSSPITTDRKSAPGAPAIGSPWDAAKKQRMPMDTLIRELPEREALMASAAQRVSRAAHAGQTLSAHVEAMRLLAEHPGSGLSFDEIEAEVARIAARSGVAVEFG